jgi:adhesin transport system membrane fusion protein
MKPVELVNHIETGLARAEGWKLRLWQRFQANEKGGLLLASFNRNPLLWVQVACVLIFLVWAMFFHLDVASYAQGQVIPAGQLKKIQHLEGGIIRSLNVVEGQQVKAGAVIAELENVAPDAEVGDLKSRAAGYEMKVARLTALLARSSALNLPKELATAYPEFARDAVSSFDSSRGRFAAMVQTNEAKISQRRTEIQEARERLIGLESRSRFIKDQVRISEDMLRQKLTNEYEHLQLKKEQAQIDSDRMSTIANERKATQALAEAVAALAAYRNEEDVNLRKELQESSSELASLRERLRKPNDSQERTVVRSPVAGSIMTLYFKNKGAVVAPGGVIATLVPEGEALQIEAKLPISEVGYVRLGSVARLSIASGGNGFSTISAEVVHISPDAAADEKGNNSFYIVRLQPKVMAFSRNGDLYPLRPGVQVTAAIISGERSVMGLLLDPFIGSGVHPLSER